MEQDFKTPTYLDKTYHGFLQQTESYYIIDENAFRFLRIVGLFFLKYRTVLYLDAKMCGPIKKEQIEQRYGTHLITKDDILPSKIAKQLENYNLTKQVRATITIKLHD